MLRSATVDAEPAEPAIRRLSPEVVADWHDRHGAELAAFLCGVLKDRSQADDALQSTFQRAIESGVVVAEGKIRAWLFQVAYREAMQLRRNQARQEKAFTEWSRRQNSGGSSTAAGDGLDAIVRKEEKALVANVIGQLPPEQRQILEQRLTDETTFAEIAGRLNIPLGTVLTRMRLALQRIRNTLDLKD